MLLRKALRLRLEFLTNMEPGYKLFITAQNVKTISSKKYYRRTVVGINYPVLFYIVEDNNHGSGKYRKN